MKRIFSVGLTLIFVLFMSLCFVGCKDYGYCFHYSVNGENGEIAIQTMDSLHPNVERCKDFSLCELDCPNDSYIVCLRGSKRGNQELTFIAIPKEGYQVKEWSFNGKIIEGNKTNSYTATVTYKQNYNGVISVEFEAIK